MVVPNITYFFYQNRNQTIIYSIWQSKKTPQDQGRTNAKHLLKCKVIRSVRSKRSLESLSIVPPTHPSQYANAMYIWDVESAPPRISFQPPEYTSLAPWCAPMHTSTKCVYTFGIIIIISICIRKCIEVAGIEFGNQFGIERAEELRSIWCCRDCVFGCRQYNCNESQRNETRVLSTAIHQAHARRALVACRGFMCGQVLSRSPARRWRAQKAINAYRVNWLVFCNSQRWHDSCGRGERRFDGWW